MTNVAALKFKQEIAEAEVVAAERRRAFEEAPELTAEEILAGFRRELRSVTIKGFGRIYYYHPMTLAARLEFESKLQEDGSTNALSVVRTIIALALNGDGTPKFSADAEDALLNRAPWQSVAQLAATLVPNVRFSVVSAEKK